MNTSSRHKAINLFKGKFYFLKMVKLLKIMYFNR